MAVASLSMDLLPARLLCAIAWRCIRLPASLVQVLCVGCCLPAAAAATAATNGLACMATWACSDFGMMHDLIILEMV